MVSRSFHTTSATSHKPKLSYSHPKSSLGFTIVELLIVVVVIAILAAITIVAYNGIQNRAKASALQTATKQAYTKVQTYAVQNAEAYPSSLATAGLAPSDGNTYQYHVNNAVSPKKFCVSASKDTVGYFMTNTQTTPQQGTCYEQNLVSTNIADWESGDYSQATGNPISSPTRVRHIGLVAVEPGIGYLFNTNAGGYSFVVRGYAADQSFTTSIGGVSSGAVLSIPAGVYYLAVGVYGSGSATFSSYTQDFNNGTIVPTITRSL